MLYPKLSIVGAGPGDPELITMKGLRHIRHADVVLYDALVNVELLHYCKPDAKKIFVGKRVNRPSFTQQRINDLIKHSCQHYDHVVRLKGGDPFVFGRGFEELMTAKGDNYSVEIIPGISSSTAAAASVHVPVTLRNVSRSFWVMTGTTSMDRMAADILIASQSSATIVIMMGLRRMAKIRTVMMKYMDSTTPIAIIWSATCSDSSMLLSTLDRVGEDLHEMNQIPDGPATIIVGAVIKAAYPENYHTEVNIERALVKMAV